MRFGLDLFVPWDDDAIIWFGASKGSDVTLVSSAYAIDEAERNLDSTDRECGCTDRTPALI